MHPDVQRIRGMSVKELVERVGPICEHLSAEGWQAMLEKVWLEGTQEDTTQFLANQFNYAKQRCEESPTGEYTMFGGETSDSIVTASNNACKTINEAWKQRGGKAYPSAHRVSKKSMTTTLRPA